MKTIRKYFKKQKVKVESRKALLIQCVACMRMCVPHSCIHGQVNGWKWPRSCVTVRTRVGGRGRRVGTGEETRNIFAHHRNSEGQMFESFKTPETGICYSGQWQQCLSIGAHGTPWAITPPSYPSISQPLHCLHLIGMEKGEDR